jgi:hypothetical protein
MKFQRSVLRNNERQRGIAKRSFKHVALKASGAMQFPMYRLDFLVRFLSRKNERMMKNCAVCES